MIATLIILYFVMFRREAIGIFGSDAAPSSSQVSRNVKEGIVGTKPKPPGKPKSVPDEVTTAMVDIIKVMRSYKIPCFHCTAIANFKRLTDGTPLGRKFQHFVEATDQWEWNEQAIDNWYKRRFLKDHPELVTGLQMSLDVARDNWCQPSNLQIYYDNLKIKLLDVSFCKFMSRTRQTSYLPSF